MATAQQLLDVARGELGTTEDPPGSNRTPYAAEAGHANGYPWCATFVVAMCRRVGITLPSESAYTPSMANGFKRAGAWHTGRPQPGDVVFFDFPDSKNRIQHVGICETATASTVTCIEGNTSRGIRGSQDNGGGVWRRTRPLSHVVGCGRPGFTAAQHRPQATRTYLEVDDMAFVSEFIPVGNLDGNGNGWITVAAPVERVLAVVPHGPYPPENGYWNAPTVSMQGRGDTTIIAVTEADPSQEVSLFVRWLKP